MRKGCVQCFLKHLGNAAVLIEEVHDGYPYRHLVLGHLDQAAQEIRAFSPRLAKVVRAHRLMLQDNEFVNYSIPFEALERYASALEMLSGTEIAPEIPDECYDGLDKTVDGGWNLMEGDMR